VRLVPGEEFGRYRIEGEIGRGGQAVVYRATQLDLDRPVALKVFEEGYLTRGGALERFRREAIAAGRLEHPRIVPVYDAGEIDGRAFMSMRLIPGDSLAERIARTGALPGPEALGVLSDIADALDFAHAHGTIHRDVKPANILLDPAGASYLSDFGLVRLDNMPGLTRRGDWLGTAEYVSPEQVEGEPATAGSDLYSLAAVAFETLTGRAPFVRREPSAVLLAQVRDPVPDASAIAPALPIAVDAALARGLSKDPAARPTSARALVDDLRDALGDADTRPTLIGAAPIAAPEAERLTQAFGDAARLRAISVRREVAVIGAVCAAVILIGAGIGGWLLGSSSADASGAEARGFAAGSRDGQAVGFARGQAKGQIAGKAEGLKTGLARGRVQGAAAGRKAGFAEGRKDGAASGAAEGRAAALRGLAPGSWYIVRVGSDDVGPVVSSSTPVSTDATQCYTVSGSRVLSGPC
jgi:serine/threonine-protein kinase